MTAPPTTVEQLSRMEVVSPGFARHVDVDPVSGCWRWTRLVLRDGYGRFTPAVASDVTTTLVHRAVYEVLVGPIPPGFVVDHTCHNADESCEGGYGCPHRRCCNPDHLEAVTNDENVARGRGHGSKTHCPHGHPYDEANTYRERRSDGGWARRCRTCRADEQRRARLRKRAA